MAEPFLSEIRLMSFNFPPKGWAFADGQLLPINQNQALFSLLGTTYGGDGRVNFALPDLRGRVPIHEGSGHSLGEKGGAESVTLNSQEMPQHLHTLTASSSIGDIVVPASNLLASPLNQSYESNANPGALQGMAAGSIANTGGSQAHQNLQPYLVISFCIALQGIFPSQT